jgi:hypothetical protein
MKKVIALLETEQRILTTSETAKKNNWWITHNLEVRILPTTFFSSNTCIEPEVGNIMEGTNNRFYKILKSQKVLICTICEQKALFKIGYRFYCKKHYKHLMLTKPIRRNIIQPNRNEPCSCGSGQKFKNCCISKLDHKPRHYFNSLYMEDPRIVNSLKTTAN